MSLNVVLARVVKEHGSVTEFVFVSPYTEDVGSEHQGRLALVSVELVDERFYHLDTCFCPLPDGGAIWFPDAFDDYGQRVIRDRCAGLIETAPKEAAQFACNTVVLDREVVLPAGCPELCGALAERGYRTHELAMSEFIKAGGACKCLTLFVPAREKALSAR